MAKKNRVFISSEKSYKIDKKSDFILSPEFYWVVEKTLPVKYIWQVKKLCDSIFDGMLPDGDYHYKVLKKQESFLIFAYDNAFILKKLESLGIDLNLINSIYFAQNELNQSNIYGLIDSALVFKNGILTQVPKKFLDAQPLNIDFIEFEKLSNCKISLDKYNFPISQKSLNFILISMMIYIGLLLIETFVYKTAFDNTLIKKNELYKKYKLPPTSIQVNAIAKKFNAIHLEQSKIRKIFADIFSIKLYNKEYISHISVEKNKINMSIVLLKPKRAEIIKRELVKNFTINMAKVKDNIFELELGYE